MSSETNADPMRPEDPAQEIEAAALDTQAAPEESPESAIERLTRERDDMRDRWLRAEAEIQNVRNRAKRDVDDTRQYAVQKFAADVVEAAENLGRGLSSLPPPGPNEPEVVTKFREGLEGVER